MQTKISKLYIVDYGKYNLFDNCIIRNLKLLLKLEGKDLRSYSQNQNLKKEKKYLFFLCSFYSMNYKLALKGILRIHLHKATYSKLEKFVCRQIVILKY